jgi:hypothetical protein
MKRFVFILLVLSATNAVGQVTLGIRAGVHGSAFINRTYNTNGVGYGPSFSTKAIAAYHAGIFADLPMLKNFSIVPEIRYIQRGANKGTYSDAVQLTHLEVPLSLCYKINTRLSVESGLVYSRTLAGKIGEYEEKEAFRPDTFGAQGGLNLHFTDRFALSALYYRGLNAVLVQTFFNPDHTVLADDRYYNGSIHLSIRYSIFQL